MDTKISIGEPAPGFTISDLAGNAHSLSEVCGRIAIVYFWSAECGWCEQADPQLLGLTQTWGDSVSLIPIASNANEDRAQLARAAQWRGLSLVLIDAEHQVADLYGALTTPHLFVIDQDGILRYQGAFDDRTFKQRTPTKNYLQMAVETLLAGRYPDPAQTMSYGCSIMRHMF
jgi:peroxiredoxin